MVLGEFYLLYDLGERLGLTSMKFDVAVLISVSTERQSINRTRDCAQLSRASDGHALSYSRLIGVAYLAVGTKHEPMGTVA